MAGPGHNPLHGRNPRCYMCTPACGGSPASPPLRVPTPLLPLRTVPLYACPHPPPGARARTSTSVVVSLPQQQRRRQQRAPRWRMHVRDASQPGAGASCTSSSGVHVHAAAVRALLAAPASGCSANVAKVKDGDGLREFACSGMRRMLCCSVVLRPSMPGRGPWLPANLCN